MGTEGFNLILGHAAVLHGFSEVPVPLFQQGVIFLTHQPLDDTLLHRFPDILRESGSIRFHIKEGTLETAAHTVKRHAGQFLVIGFLKFLQFLVIGDVFIHVLGSILVSVIGQGFYFGIEVGCFIGNLGHLLTAEFPEIPGTAYLASYNVTDTLPVSGGHSFVYLMVRRMGTADSKEAVTVSSTGTLHHLTGIGHLLLQKFLLPFVHIGSLGYGRIFHLVRQIIYRLPEVVVGSG